jgi:hypothetical protein
MNYEEAMILIKNGQKVKQGSFVYFLGKRTKDEPYTLKIIRGRPPLVIKGFKKMNKKRMFTNAI